MATYRNYLPKFDPDKRYVVRTAMVMSGKGLVPGQTFDRSLVTTRRMRQLYEQRKIVLLDPHPTKWSEEIRPSSSAADGAAPPSSCLPAPSEIIKRKRGRPRKIRPELAGAH